MIALNRRRYMGGDSGVEYLTFEDPRTWELVSYQYGDVVDKRGQEIANGTLEGDDNTQVISDYVFARGLIIYAHRDSGGASIAQKAARTVDYRVELEVTSGAGSGVPWNLDSTTIGTADTPIFQVLETTGATNASPATGAKFASVLSDGSTGWGSQSTLVSMGNNKWYADFTSTVNTNYLRVAITAASGVTVKWGITPLSTSTNACWQPVGITKAQCEAVTTLGNSNSAVNVFRQNTLITKFNEFRYFTGITSIWSNRAAGRYPCFYYCTNLESIEIPKTLADIGIGAFQSCSKLKTFDFKNVTHIDSYSFDGTGVTSYVFNEGFLRLGGTSSQYAVYPCIYGNSVYVDLPSTTTKIEKGAFNTTYMSNNLILVCRATTPPTLDTNNTRVKKVYVPSASIADYTAAANWSSLASKIYQIEGTWYETNRSRDPDEP